MNTERDRCPQTSGAARGRRRRRTIWTGAAAALLAGLLLAPEPPASSQTFHFQFGGKRPKVKDDGEDKEKNVAVALALEIGQVRQRFDQRRRGLTAMTGPDGQRVHFRREVVALIDRTEQDLDQAIARVPEPKLVGLRAWAADEIQRVRQELAGAPGEQTARWWPGFSSTPRAVAVVASLGGAVRAWLPLPMAARAATTAKDAGTIDAGKSNQLLDQVADVIGRIFFLAEKDDLEVQLWVGSTPTPKARFTFWSQGRVKDSPPTPQGIKANGKRERVPRGLYAYQAALDSGPVTRFVEWPPRAGAPAAQQASERLDLVNGTSFFCCDFKESYCGHVDDDQECRPGSR